MGLIDRILGRRPDAGRLIFAYHDGTRRRHADPVAAWSALEHACGGDPADLLKALAAAPPGLVPGTPLADEYKAKQDAAAATLARAADAAFGVGPLGDSGGRVSGLTVPERVGLVRDLALYLGGLAAAARPFASSPSPTADSPPG